MPVVVLLFALAAAQPAPASHRAGDSFISPMGEPFTASSASGDALATWFAQADRNHDGSLTASEMQQDAERFFATLDLNHDGEIDPDEMTNYETVVAPQVHTGAAGIGGSTDPQSDQLWSGAQNADGSRGPIEGNGGGDMRSAAQGGNAPKLELGLQGAGRFGLLNIPQPVAAADTNFNRGVSTEEFRRASSDRFGFLDTNHDGRLTLPELEAQRIGR